MMSENATAQHSLCLDAGLLHQQRCERVLVQFNLSSVVSHRSLIAARKA